MRRNQTITFATVVICALTVVAVVMLPRRHQVVPQTPTPPHIAVTRVTPPITGFGALAADWNATHTVDTRHESNTAYNATPGLGTESFYNDAYYAVYTQAGRVVGYNMRLVNGSDQSTAQAVVMKEFPGDTQVVWSKVKDSCSQLEVKSAALGQSSVLGSADFNDSQGEVLVEFQTATITTENLPSYYAPSNVNTATLSSGVYPNASSAPGC